MCSSVRVGSSAMTHSSLTSTPYVPTAASAPCPSAEDNDPTTGLLVLTPPRRLTFPRMCSRSSITTSLTLAAPTAIPRLNEPIQYDELRIEHERAVKCRTAVRSMGPVVATSLLLVLVGIVLGGVLGGLLLLVLLLVVVKVAGLPHRRSPFRYITSVSRFLMRNMNGQLSLMGARSDKSALQAARVRGLAAGNRCHWLGSPAFRHRSMIHSHLSARSMGPARSCPRESNQEPSAEEYRPAECPTLRAVACAGGPRACGCLGGRAFRRGRESRNPSATYQSQRNGASVCAGGP